MKNQLTCHMSLLFVLFMLGCGEAKQKVALPEHIHQLTLESYKDFAEIDYLSGLYNISYDDGFIYLSDGTNGRVVKTDTSLNVDLIIGSKGEGPGEFNTAGIMQIAQGRLLVESVDSRRLGVFDLNGNFLDWISIANYPLSTQYAVHDDLIFISASKKEQNISVISTDSEFQFAFGSSQFTEDPRQMKARNTKHLGIVTVEDQPHLIALNESEPLLELYTLDGEKLFSQNLEKVPFVAPALETGRQARKEDSANRYKTYIVFYNIFVVNDNLYTYIAASNPPHRFLRFEIQKDRAIFKESFEITEHILPRAFALNDEKFFVYDRRSLQVLIYSRNPNHETH